MSDAHPLDIPPFLLRDANNQAEFMRMSTEATVETTKPKAKPAPKANGAAKPAAKAAVKAADKPKAKAAAKPAAKAKAAPKATAKASKPKAEGGKKDKWGFREGSAKSKAVEMYTSKAGATLNEVKAAVGSIQLNVLKSLEAEGHTVIQKKEQLEGQRPITRYWLKAKKA